jgi:hypothetical protein
MRIDVNCPHCGGACGFYPVLYGDDVHDSVDWYCPTCKTYFDLEVDVDITVTPFKKKEE